MTISKRCIKCYRTLPIINFSGNSQRSDGLDSRCKHCKNAAQQKIRSAIRVRMIALKLTLACVDCGWKPTTEEDVSFLEFDHIDPATKSGAIGAVNVRNWSWARIEQEIALCEPRCNRCHRLRTEREHHSRPQVAVPAAQDPPDPADWPTLF